MRVVFTDLSAHTLCSDNEAAAAYWGAGWSAVSFCLSLLINSFDVADLRLWTALDIRVVDDLIRITHRGATFTLAALADDGTVLGNHEEGTMEDLDRIRSAQLLDITCDGLRAADWREC